MTVAVADVLDWLGITEADLISAATPRTQRVLDAVTAKIRATNAEPVLPDTPTDDEQTWFDQQTAAWNQAIIMAAARYVGRRNTITGVMEFEGGAIRVGRFDGDVDALLEQFTVWGMA